MIRHRLKFVNEPIIDLATFEEQLAHAQSQLSLQNPLPILWREYYVVSHAVMSMSTVPKEYLFDFHSVIVPSKIKGTKITGPPPRLLAGLRGGRIPALEGRGL
jgi:hypothetical protein